MNISDSMSSEFNINNSCNSTEVARIEESANYSNSVANNSHDSNDDSDFDSDSSTSDISELEILNVAFKDAVLDDSACLDLADNVDLSFNISYERMNESSKRISSPPIPELSSCTENDTITDKNDAIYDGENEYSSIRDDSQSQSEEISNISCQNVSNLLVESNTNRSQNNNVLSGGAPDDEQMFVVHSNQEIRKKHFCFYCKTFQTVISRHLPTVHKNEPEVRELLMLKPRLKDGEKLVTRQPNAKNQKKASEYKTCHKCLGAFYSIHRHRLKCLGESSMHHRSNPALSRAVSGHIHKNSNQKLRKIFSVMRDDDVTRVLRYDALLIAFGNELCDKYTKQQQHDMIRSRLRDLGKLILKVHENQDNEKYIYDFSSLIDPQMHKYTLTAIKEINGADSDNRSCRAPSTALSYGIYIKKIARCYRRQCLENEEYDNLETIKYFLQLHEDKYPIVINKLAHEIQTVNKRHKKVVLPLTSDIKIFWSYVRNQYNKALTNLNAQYSYSDYHDLNKSTLLLVLIFNRKRPGELERVTIADYKSATKFSETNKEEYEKLSEENKKFVNEYIRFELGGKKDRNVPVIISREMKTGTETAGRYKHLRICILMREFSEKSNVSNPKTLRTTTLRKHVTTVATLKIAESRIHDISNFMGHAEAIHRQHYRQAVVSRDLCEVSQILEVATGIGQDPQTTIVNSDAMAICDNDATQSKLIDESQPDMETIESDDDMRNGSDDSEDSIETKHQKKKIWSEYETNTTATVFEQNVMNMKLPSSFEIREFLKKHPNIMRTEAQIRTLIHNKYKARQQRRCY
ncbi:hypothetical protein PV327_007444 [Microctonus hyperodae]|uniref:Uncharacterized protein n=1 Tax=Microctonus hyperodae TaxID=165561 RepID=A0AA39FZM7_MICHY|nr:hypothetical protein PV327_007444 [Microctonus hyperodae]